MEELDNDGKTVAEQISPDLIAIRQISTITNSVATVYLTPETINYLATEFKEKYENTKQA
jgi:hypothetical protein